MTPLPKIGYEAMSARKRRGEQRPDDQDRLGIVGQQRYHVTLELAAHDVRNDEIEGLLQPSLIGEQQPASTSW